MLTLLPKSVQTKELKLSDWRFFPFATCVNEALSCGYLREFLQKNRNRPNMRTAMRNQFELSPFIYEAGIWIIFM
jgi:hypothetical protein